VPATISPRRLNNYSSNFLTARKFARDKKILPPALNPGAAALALRGAGRNHEQC
jgi:hypothetical protein